MGKLIYETELDGSQVLGLLVREGLIPPDFAGGNIRLAKVVNKLEEILPVDTPIEDEVDVLPNESQMEYVEYLQLSVVKELGE